MFSRARPKHDAKTTEALARAGIRPSATWREKVASAFSAALDTLRDRDELLATARQAGLDQFHGIDRAVKRDIGNLPVEQDPYIAARLANGGASAVMRAILLHGQARWTANGQHLEKIPGTKGLPCLCPCLECRPLRWHCQPRPLAPRWARTFMTGSAG